MTNGILTISDLKEAIRLFEEGGTLQVNGNTGWSGTLGNDLILALGAHRLENIRVKPKIQIQLVPYDLDSWIKEFGVGPTWMKHTGDHKPTLVTFVNAQYVGGYSWDTAFKVAKVSTDLINWRPCGRTI